MTTLSSPGIGSGIDVRGIIGKLMSVEQQPLLKINTRVVELKTQLSAYGALKSSVSGFRDAIDKLADPTRFKAFEATSSDEKVATASASSSAAKGVYTLNVLRIAENHRMAAGTTYANTDTAVLGTAGDRMTIAVGSAAFNVDFGGKTLGAIRDEINSAATNTGVTASILKDNVGYRLSLSSNGTGGDKAIGVTYTGPDPFALQTLNADRDTSGGFTIADLNASVQLEGQFNITSSSNTLSETIQGVSITLQAAGTTTVKIDRDTASVEASVQSFVKAYSDLIGNLSKMRGQALKSDSSGLASIESQMRNVLSQQVDVEGSFNNAFEIGISTQKNGTLTLDSKVLNNAITANFDGLAKLFADPNQGLAKRLSSLATSFLDTGGMLDGRSQGLSNQISTEESKKALLEERLKIIEVRLTKQYNSLDLIVSRMQGSANLLTQQLSGLSNLNQR